MGPYIPIIFAYPSDNKTPSYYRKFFWKLKWEWRVPDLGEKGQSTTRNLLCQTSIARHGREADAFAWFDQLCAFQPSSDHHASHFNLYLGFAVGQNGQVVLPSRPHFDHHQLYFGLNYVFLKKGGHRTPKWSICIHLYPFVMRAWFNRSQAVNLTSDSIRWQHESKNLWHESWSVR